jgi:hypothetical protein
VKRVAVGLVAMGVLVAGRDVKPTATAAAAPNRPPSGWLGLPVGSVRMLTGTYCSGTTSADFVGGIQGSQLPSCTPAEGNEGHLQAGVRANKARLPECDSPGQGAQAFRTEPSNDLASMARRLLGLSAEGTRGRAIRVSPQSAPALVDGVFQVASHQLGPLPEEKGARPSQKAKCLGHRFPNGALDTYFCGVGSGTAAGPVKDRPPS